jgi:ABC-2 type transport system ATP-binding protein
VYIVQLTINKVNKSFEKNHVLKDISFTVNSGAAFGYLGRNGSGKTTTIRIIMDIFKADSGEVLIDSVPNTKAKLKIGYLPEERGLYPKKNICDQMVYLGELRGMAAKDARKSAQRLLEKLDAGQYFKKRLDTLSKGNQQKIQLAIALLNDPDIVILDEPFSGLDPVNAKILKDIVTETVSAGKTVVFSSHQMASVEEICDDIALINGGEIVLSGSLKKIKKAYPRNRVLLVPESDHYDALLRFVGGGGEIKKFVADFRQEKNGCIVTLTDEKAKTALFNAISDANVSLDAFSVVEPTLEEIFVEKAGDVHETL